MAGTSEMGDARSRRHARTVLERIFGHVEPGLRYRLWDGSEGSVGNPDGSFTLVIRDRDTFRETFGSNDTKVMAEAFADEYIDRLNIKTASTATPIRSLSGGNQQKVILARWLLTHPEYLILDEPTRGIDVGTKVEIQKLVLRLAEEGVSVTFISSEIEEMLRTCSRLIVMKDRAIVGELSGEDLTESVVMRVIAGGNE